MTIDKGKSKVHELLYKGAEYREDFDFELYGEEVTVIIRPLPDPEFLPLIAVLDDRFDIDEDVEQAEAVDEARDKIEEARDDGEIDVSEMDEEFVAVMQNAAARGLEGTYDDDGERVDIGDSEAEEMVKAMTGGTSIELAARVLELSGSVREAKNL